MKLQGQDHQAGIHSQLCLTLKAKLSQLGYLLNCHSVFLLSSLLEGLLSVSQGSK